MTEPPTSDDLTMFPTPPPADDHPPVIGPYRLLRLIGTGGMGQVWLAERTEPVRQVVALKRIRLGMDTQQVLARFESERQTLARMDHPNIAKVFDAGSDADGRPYFVMEYVQGRPLTEHCDEHQLSIRARLELFVQVCRGVQHAHQKGVIHRDIKPGNILVEYVDGQATPKIIDFGIARATDQDLTEETRFTVQGQLVGTPEYMSPEQAALSTETIDTRSDVYALGVLLYELLTGALPFDSGSLRRAGWAEVERIIREVDPPRPSTRLGSFGAPRGESGRPPTARPDETVARNRQTRIRTLAQELRGDLDWITMRCLEKEPARRYAAASELAADIQRHLSHQPVEAGPPTARYRLRKFVRRNRTLVGTLGSIAVVLVLAVIGMSILSSWALRERARAEAGRARAEAITDFVTEALVSTDPTQGGEHGFTVSAAMQQALDLLNAGALRGQPETEVGLRLTISSVLDGNGDAPAALSEAQRALDLNQALHPGDHPMTVAAWNNLGVCYFSLGKLDEALAAMQAASDMEQRLEPGGTLDHATNLNTIGTCLILLGREDESLDYFEEALAIRRRMLPPEAHEITATLGNMGAALLYAARYDEALVVMTEVLQTYQQRHHEDHPSLAQAYNNVACCLEMMGRSEEALPHLETGLAMKQRLFPGDHPEVAKSLANVGSCLISLDRQAEALPLLEAALAMRERLVLGDHPGTATSLTNVASCLEALGRDAEALPYYESALAMDRRLYDGDHPETSRSLSNLAASFERLGRDAQARPLYEEAIRMGEAVLAADHPQRLYPRLGLARVLTRQGEYAAAAVLLARAAEQCDRSAQSAREHGAALAETAVELYEAWDAAAPGQGHDRAAADWRAKGEATRSQP